MSYSIFSLLLTTNRCLGMRVVNVFDINDKVKFLTLMSFRQTNSTRLVSYESYAFGKIC
jgi:hypothetical protein